LKPSPEGGFNFNGQEPETAFAARLTLTPALVRAKRMKAIKPIALLLLLTSASVTAHAENSATVDLSGGSYGQQQVIVDYRVWRVRENKSPKGFTIAIVTLAPQRFNKRDISLLADQLNKRFASEQRVQVGLLDDENTARLFIEGRLEYPAYTKAERGRYYLDRTQCKEYVQFHPQGRKVKQMIRLNCSRPEATGTSTGVRRHEPAVPTRLAANLI